MLTLLPQKFPIDSIIKQVSSIDVSKRIELNTPTGEFFGDPWQTKSEYLNTPLGDVLASLGNIGQARLLCLDSGQSYTAHCDPDDRIHLSIITNQYCFLVDIDDEKLYHLHADGKIWLMDTGKTHVATNWGPRSRIHLCVRKLLPKYDNRQKGLSIKVLEGDYDWKQQAYTPIMKIINYGVKNNSITGFKGISEREVIINTNCPEIFDIAFSKIAENNIELEVKLV